MRLRNKKTGEIINIYKGEITLHYNQGRETIHFKRLEDLEEWEDYEEPKEYWCITGRGNLHYLQDMTDENDKDHREIGNYFETEEEAEKAVDKLKAWKRLKDKGFRFDHIRSIDGVSIKHKDLNQYTIIAYADEDGCDQECLALIFGGGE